MQCIFDYLSSDLVPEPPTMYGSLREDLSTLAAFNVSAGGDQRIQEVVELWNEEISTIGAAIESISGGREHEDPNKGTDGAIDDSNEHPGPNELRLSYASILCSAAQGDLMLRRGMATASGGLAEGLKAREELVPSGHPTMAIRCIMQVASIIMTPHLASNA